MPRRKGLPEKAGTAFGGEEEDDAMARSFHETVLSGKLRQAVRRATDWEGGRCLLPGGKCTKTGRTFADVLREKHPDMRVSPMENPMCAAFEEYEEVPETVVARLVHLRIETAGTQEEAEEGMSAALGMEVEVDRGSEGKEGGGGTQ